MAESEKIDTRASISRLPSELLLKILSHLPLRQALATSILSNTWKALCSQFLEQNNYRIAYFDDFVLISLRRQKYIRRLKHSSTSSSNPSDLTRWIETAIIQREIDMLDVFLCSCSRKVVPLPSSVFTCSTIVVLKLINVILNESDSDSDSDSISVCLPSLKVLHLKSVSFGSLGTINNLLLSSMNILEDLTLKNISISGQIGVVSCNHKCKSFPKLIRANIESSIFIPLDSVHNVESLKICPIYHRFYGDFRYPDSRTFQNMVSMEKLEGFFIPWIDNPNSIPECLSSHLRTCYIKGFGSKEGSACVIPFAKYIVKNGRVLETMTISCIDQFAKDLINGELLSWQKSSPTCQVNIIGGSSS
ncbi:putative F-box domain, FBD domain, leucine-rich repeat domain, L domain-containing protein [Senna tora]|uniref:Putative F-box domain, FBD domain, leucine-rich repeat domain, L domain-containing protein n=1 Tax=Senna tora TaxID=362788 RepID=A0A834TP94_9FABA|nr:putative F-box domain, FBD domain, leucine-rich repeat domain, L domain-containing protein [Senna tora]